MLCWLNRKNRFYVLHVKICKMLTPSGREFLPPLLDYHQLLFLWRLLFICVKRKLNYRGGTSFPILCSSMLTICNWCSFWVRGRSWDGKLDFCFMEQPSSSSLEAAMQKKEPHTYTGGLDDTSVGLPSGLRSLACLV